MLDLANSHRSQSLLYFSSSEIYGDPPAEEIPTREIYRGNVACIGPRACYDESKRLGETLCYLYAQQYEVPAKIVGRSTIMAPGFGSPMDEYFPTFVGMYSRTETLFCARMGARHARSATYLMR